MNSERNIQYTGRDFTSLRSQLIEFAKNYFPDTYTDFTATSPGMMFMEMAAYVGDVLSFYQDTQLQETFLQYAKNPNNLYTLAYMMGYKPKVTTAASVNLTVSQIIPASGSSGSFSPNWNKVYRLGENSQILSATSGTISFLTKNPVDFGYSSSADPTTVSVGDIDTSGNPLTFILTKKVKAYSGTIKSTNFTFGSYQKYQTVELSDNNIIGILDAQEVGDLTESGSWYEVPFLGQDTIFVDSLHENVEANGAQFTLALKKVPKRFVTRFTTNGTLQIQFGAGMYADDANIVLTGESNYLPNPTTLSEDQNLSRDRFDVAYDPSNFLFSKSYGLAPVNKEITFRYVVGGGVSSNVESYTLTKAGALDVSSKDGSTVDLTTLGFMNEEAASGGRNGDELEEIRQNALRSFAEQKRMVTLNDFNVRALALPPKYGTVAKAYAVGDLIANEKATSLLDKDSLAISLYVLGYDINGKLTASSTSLKENLKTYLSEYLMLTDAINIKDAYIINVGVKYDIVLKPNSSSSDTLLKCNKALQTYFRTEIRSINETINLSDIYSLLDQIPGVQTVKNVVIENKYGEGYSEYSYDIKAATKNGIVYPSYDISIFEVKFPEVDIEGRVTTLL